MAGDGADWLPHVPYSTFCLIQQRYFHERSSGGHSGAVRTVGVKFSSFFSRTAVQVFVSALPILL